MEKPIGKGKLQKKRVKKVDQKIMVKKVNPMADRNELKTVLTGHLRILKR